MLLVGYPVEDFVLLVLGVPLELSLGGIHKGSWVTQASSEEYRELVPRDRDRGFGDMFLLVLLPMEADPVRKKDAAKKIRIRSHSSSGSKIVLTLLTEVVAVYVGLSAIYVWGTGLQLLLGCLRNNRSWSENGSGSENRSGSENGNRSGNGSGSGNGIPSL